MENSAEVAILDSVYEPGDSFCQNNNVGRTMDVLNDGKDRSTNHGIDVASIISYYCNNPKIHFCRFVQQNNKFRDRDLMKAVHTVSQHDEIDILNISAGTPHINDPDFDCSSTGPACPVCDVVENAANSGLIVVAAAGNEEEKGIQCPSLSEKVTSVGGVVSECTAKISRDDPLLGPSSPANPPNAYWVDRGDENSDDIYCTNRGCFPGESCSENRVEKSIWDEDAYTETKPDILAPILYSVELKDGPAISAGTSFGAPIVSAGIINTLNGLYNVKRDPTSTEIRASIKRSGRSIRGSEKSIFCQRSFAEEIGEIYDLKMNIDSDHDDEIMYNTIGRYL